MLRWFVLIYLLLLGPVPGLGRPANGAPPADVAAIAAQVAPGVVHLTGYLHAQSDEPYVEASGFFIDRGGLLFTVASVFTNQKSRHLCERYLVRLFDGRVVQAKMHSVDPMLNLMLLKVTTAGDYPTVTMGDTASSPGDPVLALAGSNGQAGIPYTAGYIQATHRRSVYGAGLGDMFLNTRLRVPEQAYGGPLVNGAGEVIGIDTPNIYRAATQAADPQEGHAVPAIILKGYFRMAKDHPASEQKWIGMAFRTLAPDEKEEVSKRLGHRIGLAVDFVWPEGPAGQSDIMPGDVLICIDNEDLPDLHPLNRRVSGRVVDTRVTLALLRREQVLFRQVSVEMRPSWAAGL